MNIVSFVVDALQEVYGGGFATDVASWLQQLIYAMNDIISSTVVDLGFTILGGIAGSLLVLYFFMNVADMAMRDMFSFEKLIMAFIKMMIGVCICLYAKDITRYMVEIGASIFDLLNNNLSRDTTGNLFNSNKYDDFVETLSIALGYDDEKFLKSLRVIVFNFGWVISSMLIYVIGLVSKIAAFFIATSTVVMLCVRVFFSPIAVVNIFEGSHSSGVRYFKSILADACSLGAMLVVLYMASKLASSISADIPSEYLSADGKYISATREAVTEALKLKYIIPALVPQIAAIGGMGGVSRIMREVFGT